MIQICAVCKSDIFIKAMRPFLFDYEILITRVCKSWKLMEHGFEGSKTDILLMDGNWNSNHKYSAGTKAAASFKIQYPHIKLIVVTTTFEVQTLEKYRQIPIEGYFFRSCANVVEAFAQCVHDVYRGKQHFLIE